MTAFDIFRLMALIFVALGDRIISISHFFISTNNGNSPTHKG